MSYNAQAASALRMLERYGSTMTLSRTTNGTRDVVSQSSTPAAVTEQLIAAVVLPATLSRDMTNDQRAQVIKNCRLLYIAGRAPDGSALAIEPSFGDTIPFEGSTWAVSTVSRLAPDGGLPILFTAEVSR